MSDDICPGCIALAGIWNSFSGVVKCNPDELIVSTFSGQKSINITSCLDSIRYPASDPPIAPAPSIAIVI